MLTRTPHTTRIRTSRPARFCRSPRPAQVLCDNAVLLRLLRCSVPYAYFSRTRMGCPYAYGQFFLAHTRMGYPYAYGLPIRYRGNLLVRPYAYECPYAHAYLPDSFDFQLASYSCSYYRWHCAWVSINMQGV